MFKFVNKVEVTSASSSFYANLHNINGGEEELLTALKEKLLFPDYFGNNWDALYDCLCDLSWINEFNVIIVHEDLPSIDEKSMKTYLEILSDACNKWDSCNEKHIEIIFLQKHESTIKELMEKDR